MWALRAWSMISTGTSSLCAKFHNRFRTLWAITPSLSSSAKRLINSSSFSRCFLLALVQLACRKTQLELLNWCYINPPHPVFSNLSLSFSCKQIPPPCSNKYYWTGKRIRVKYRRTRMEQRRTHTTELGHLLLTLKQSNRWSSCSGEKSQASFASRSCTFFTMASCLPAYRQTQQADPNFHFKRLLQMYSISPEYNEKKAKL